MHANDQTEQKMQASNSTVDPQEILKFERMAAEWWDPNGKFKPLHMLNPCRLDYILTQITAEFDCDMSLDKPFKGLRILDIGCGSGELLNYMRKIGLNGEYCGIDFIKEFVEHGNNFFKNDRASSFVQIDIENDENLLLLGMNTDVVIEVLNKEVSLSTPTMSLRTRKDNYS